MWYPEEVKWIEANRVSIENKDLEKLFLELGRANLQGFNKSRLTCGLAFILNLPMRITPITDKMARVLIIFGNYVRLVSELNVSDSKNLSLIVVKFNRYLEDNLTLPGKVIEYLLNNAWTVGVVDRK